MLDPGSHGGTTECEAAENRTVSLGGTGAVGTDVSGGV